MLILGGTGEALALAWALDAAFAGRLRLVSSLAGRTRSPRQPPGEVRIGGFGGAGPLADWLRGHRIDAVIDATHPFASAISANAAAACDDAGVPRLVLERAPWLARPGDRWHDVADAAHAAALLPSLGRRAFLTLGPRDLAPFGARAGIWFLVRQVDPPAAPPLAGCAVITGRGPFEAAAERRLLLEHTIDVLVTRASGGAATVAKLDAARELGLPVVMIRRPPPPPGPRVASMDDAVAWAARQCGLDTDGEFAHMIGAGVMAADTKRW
ncbi:MAG: cobalt-precorrin-6A reductase [Alphaproteobacteria bacterium]|nr:cobalt-precorrin-6A reductase [Alphaproteobacteria bacterium]